MPDHAYNPPPPAPCTNVQGDVIAFLPHAEKIGETRQRSARQMSVAEAQRDIAAKLLGGQPGAQAVQVARIFRWLKTEAVVACQAARQAGLKESSSIHRIARSK